MSISLRELAANHRPVMTVVAAIVLVGSIAIIVGRSGGRGPRVVMTGGQGYFYDLSSHAILVDDNSRVAPYSLDSGAVVVRAAVYSCGDCAAETDRRIAYLSRYNDEAHRQLEEAGDEVTAQLMDEVSRSGREIALPPRPGVEPVWMDLNHPAAMQVVERLHSACGGGPATECRP